MNQRYVPPQQTQVFTPQLPQSNIGLPSMREPEAVKQDPISVFLGTTAESTAEQATFGIFKPDIIPQDIEQLSPIASTAGHVIGGLVGFMGSTAATGFALGTAGKALQLTSFGRRFIGFSKLMSGAVKGGVEGAVGATRMSDTTRMIAANWSLQDVTRTFVQQMKENDPDTYELGVAAVRGYLTGGVLHLSSRVFAEKSAVTQLLAGGTSFSVAEAINLASRGEDISNADMARSFLTGLIFSAYPALTHKRATYKNFKKARDNSAELFKSLDNVAAGTVDPKKVEAEIYRALGDHGELAIDVLKKEGIVIKSLKDLHVPILREARGGIEKIAGASGGKKGEAWAHQKLHDLFVAVGYRDIKKTKVKVEKDWYKPLFPEKSKPQTIKTAETTAYGKSIIRSYTNGRTDKIRHLTVHEVNDIYSDITEYLSMQLTGWRPEAYAKQSFKARSTLGTWFRATEKDISLIGMGDLIDDPVDAARFMKVVNEELRPAVNRAANLYYSEAKAPLGQQPFTMKQTLKRAVKKGVYAEQWKKDDLTMALHIEDPAVLAEAKKLMTPKQREAFDYLRGLTEYMFKRTNESRAQLGLELIPHREGYFHHITTVENEHMSWGSVARSAKRKPKPTIGQEQNPTVLPQTGSEFVRDPVRSINAMLNYDLKSIFLHNPIRLVQARLDNLVKMRAVPQDAVNAVMEIVDYGMLNRQTPAGIKQNADLAKLLSHGKIDKAINSGLKYLFGQDLGAKPADALASAYGKAITNSFMAARLDLAFRNCFQTLYVIPKTSTKALAKAMTMREIPKEWEEFMQSNATYLVSGLGATEDAMTSSVSAASMGMFSGSHFKFNIRNTSLASLIHFEDKVNIPFGKSGSWATESGQAFRAKMREAGKENWRRYLAPDEKLLRKHYYDNAIKDCQFVYDSMGLGNIFKNPAGKIGFKLLSYPMNYTLSYVDSLVREFSTGRPSWAPPTSNIKLTAWERAGLFKHFIGLGALVAVLERAGMDYSSIVGISPTLDKDKKVFGVPAPLNVGVWNFRPSPSVQLFKSVVGLLDSDPYKRAIAQREVKVASGALAVGSFAPGMYSAGKVKKAVETGEVGQLVYSKKYERKKKKPQVFQGFSGFNGF